MGHIGSRGSARGAATYRSRIVGCLATALTTAAVAGCTGEPQAAPPASSHSSASASSSPSATAPPAGSASPSTSPGVVGPQVQPTGRPRDVATDLEAPWSVAFLQGTALISERDSARILELRGDGSTRVVGQVSGVAAGGEAGLLGLAVDAEDRLYVYSTGERENRVQRYPLHGEAGSLTLGDPTTILDGIPAADRHDGGRIAFGPDGMLYVATGDVTDSSHAQDRDSLAGKILRMTPDGDAPADNPFSDSLIYSYGHRNVEGLAWAADGTMFATEFGQDRWDELNIIEPGGNYGWPQAEGRSDDSDLIDPVQQWSPGEASPSGLAAAEGTLFIANLRGEVLRAVPVKDPARSTEYYTGQYGRLRDVTVDPQGHLWIVTNNTDGRGDPRRGDDRILSVDLE